MLSFSIIFRRFLLRFQHQQQFVIVKHNARAHFQKRVDNKNTIQDGGSTALFAAYTVDTVYTVYTVCADYTIYTFYIVDTVDTALFTLFKLFYTSSSMLLGNVRKLLEWAEER